MFLDCKLISFHLLDKKENIPNTVFPDGIYENENPNVTFNSTGDERYYINRQENQNSLLNKKRQRETNKSEKTHNKFSEDNLKRVCKHLVIENVMKFLNKKIYDAYDGNIGDGILKKELVKLEQSQKKNSKAEFNKEFLNKTMKEILSNNITKKIKKYDQEHNKKLINKLVEEKNDIFEKLFNLTFIECADHFSGNKKIKELDGLTLLSELKEQIIKKYPKDGDSYFQNLEKYMKEFEKRINNAKPKPKK